MSKRVKFAISCVYFSVFAFAGCSGSSSFQGKSLDENSPAVSTEEVTTTKNKHDMEQSHSATTTTENKQDMEQSHSATARLEEQPMPPNTSQEKSHLQQWTVPAQDQVKKVDLLLIVDKSASMKSSIQNVKEKLSTFFSNLPNVDLKVGLTLHENPRQDANKNYNEMTFQQFLTLPKATLLSKNMGVTNMGVTNMGVTNMGVTKEWRYNTLNFVLDNELWPGDFYRRNSVAGKDNSQIETLKQHLELSNLVFNDSISHENALCPALLGYQSVTEGFDAAVRPERSGFRKDADLFSAVVISDENISLQNGCGTLVSIAPERSPYCECRIYGTQDCGKIIGYYDETSPCPTDDNPKKMCTSKEEIRDKECIEVQKYKSASCDTCPCDGFPQTSCQQHNPRPEFEIKNKNMFDGVDFLASIQNFKHEFTPKRHAQLNFVGFTGVDGCTPTSANPGASVGTEYMNVAQATAGLTTCIQDDFSQVFAKLSTQMNFLVNNVAIERPENTIVSVSVNDLTLSKGQFSVHSGVLIINANLLKPGNTVEIRYSVP